MIHMDYQQAQDYILGFTDYEKIPGIAYTAANYDLRRMEKLLAPLGNPHLGRRTVHIAGTKGKGSTAAMIVQSLIVAGFKTGLFTSPHLHTIRERVKIDNNLISEIDFASIATELEPVVTMVHQEAAFGQLTTFEILTALVFIHFKKNNADIQVLEVGLGGRLDATNIARGDICVITSLSLDHTEILGTSLAEIATEKAGIIKPGSIVVSSPQREEAANVIEITCRQQKAALIRVGKDVTLNSTIINPEYQSFTVYGRRDTYKLDIPLLGIHQLENAATAVATLEALDNLGIHIPASAITAGFKQVNWPGRLQILQYHPLVVVDGAHNAYSMKKLVEAIQELFSYEKCHVIFGTSCDKDIPGMALELETIVSQIIITSSTHPRAAPASIIAKEFEKYGIKATVLASVNDALSLIPNYSQKNDLVLITGSLFIVAEAIEFFQHNNTQQSSIR